VGGRGKPGHDTRIANLKPIIDVNVAREAPIITDEWTSNRDIGVAFASHDVVTHSADEYVRHEGGKVISTNTVEGYYSIFKRRMKGTYSIARRSICTPNSPSLISVTAIASVSVSTMKRALSVR